jgi:hypothetical protein
MQEEIMTLIVHLCQMGKGREFTRRETDGGHTPEKAREVGSSSSFGMNSRETFHILFLWTFFSLLIRQ